MYKIVLASVLKPIDDVRMFEKIGRSLAKRFEVHIVGYRSKQVVNEKNINFHSIYNFHRKSKSRFYASFLFYKKISKLSPDLIIIHTVELLPIIYLYKVFNIKVKLIYDIRENYFYNIKYQSIYPWYIKSWASYVIRLIEFISKIFVNHYFLAENSYSEELNFLNGNYTILENKCFKEPRLKKNNHQNDSIQMLFPGTISKVYGAEEAIDFIESLNQNKIKSHLTFIGKVIEKDLLDRIQKLSIEKKEYLTLIGGNQLVSHNDIIYKMLKTDFVLLSYQKNKSIKKCIPTRLYECLAFKIPMIIQENQLWKQICCSYNAAIFIDFKKYNIEDLIHQIKTKSFYNGILEIEYAFWQSEEKKLLNVINQILNA